MSILAKLFGDPNKSFLKQAQQVVAEIGDLEGQLQTYSAEQLAAKTSELKTKLAASEQLTDLLPLALYLNALEGQGCHLVTVNDYLARRDSVWMGQIFHALGLTVGCITHEQ